MQLKLSSARPSFMNASFPKNAKGAVAAIGLLAGFGAIGAVTLHEASNSTAYASAPIIDTTDAQRLSEIELPETQVQSRVQRFDTTSYEANAWRIVAGLEPEPILRNVSAYRPDVLVIDLGHFVHSPNRVNVDHGAMAQFGDHRGMSETDFVDVLAPHLQDIAEEHGVTLVFTRQPGNIMTNPMKRGSDGKSGYEYRIGDSGHLRDRADFSYYFCEQVQAQSCTMISLHTDDVEQNRNYASGSTAYTSPREDEWSRQLARSITVTNPLELSKTSTNEASFWVLNRFDWQSDRGRSDMITAAALLELGFTNHPDDLERLGQILEDPEFAREVAERIFDGYMNYLNDVIQPQTQPRLAPGRAI